MFMADKVFAHRWPRDTPEWTPDDCRFVDEEINIDAQKEPVDSLGYKNLGREISLYGDIVTVGGYAFESVKNVGLSVPFFKDECRMMFEACYDARMYAHFHVYVREEEEYLEAFDMIRRWKRELGC